MAQEARGKNGKQEKVSFHTNPSDTLLLCRDNHSYEFLMFQFRDSFMCAKGNIYNIAFVFIQIII